MSTASGARFAIMIVKSRAIDRPSVSVAETVMVAESEFRATIERIAPAMATSTTLVFEEAAMKLSESPSGSEKWAERSTSSVSPTSN